MDDNTMPTEASPPLLLEQHGRVGELLPVVLLNTLLNIVTLSIYRFWGKTRVRRYLWRQTHFMGEPLEYSGNGGELFKGFLVVFFLILLPLGVISKVADTYLDPLSMESVAYSTVFFVFTYLLVGFAIYRARRYRLSRTRWRGIRGGMKGSASGYATRYLLYWMLNFATLAWAYPWLRVKLFQRLMGETTFGDRSFRVDDAMAPLYRVFALYWIGSALVSALVMAATVYPWGGGDFVHQDGQLVYVEDLEFHWKYILQWRGIVIWLMVMMVGWVWYRAREINHFADLTSFSGVSFRMKATTWSLTGLMFINGLLVLLTLGFAQPLAQLRTFRYFCDRLEMIGDLNPDWIRQSSAQTPSTGEGLADAFALGAV